MSAPPDHANAEDFKQGNNYFYSVGFPQDLRLFSTLKRRVVNRYSGKFFLMATVFLFANGELND